jgi:hypothetical protein
MTTMLPRIQLRWSGAQHIQRIALLARITAVALACVLVLALLLALEAGSADARTPAATPVSGVVSIADGAPFTIIRQSTVYSGSKGVAVQSGDFIETQPGTQLVIGLTGGSLLGIGPSSQVYILQRAEIPTLIVLRGWVKADIRGSAAVPALRVVGTRLGFQSQQAVVLIHAADDRDALFDEQGSGTLLSREEAATRTDRLTQPNQFWVRADRELVVTQKRPSTDFLADMPPAFRDSLPEQTTAQSQKPVEARQVRDVTYADIQAWLAIPHDWRSGFIARFRGRLKDPVFAAALDAHLTQFPEWVPILHPPPPPDEDELPAAAQPAPQRSAEATPAAATPH